MATTNQERIGRALALVAQGLEPIVAREFTKAYGPKWIDVIAAKKEMETGFATVGNPSDPQFLLNAVFFNWRETLGSFLGAEERNYVAELRSTRNRWAHPDPKKPFDTDDVYRAFDTAERLLSAVSAPEAAELAKAKLEILRVGYEAKTKQEVKKVAEAATLGTPASGLKPWRSIITPHADVAAGRYSQAEFAADLAQVARGEGTAEYVDPREFFARTFITEGLRLLLVGALQRLAGTGGDPVIELQTNFGGGKTHSMLALYHLVDPGVDLTALPGLEPVLKAAGVTALPSIRRAVLVGQALSPGIPRRHDGLEIRTLWGELAWQLGGADGYAMVAEADVAGVSPGSTVLVDLFTRFGPALILIDEWVAYVRQLYTNPDLPAGSFDANLSFAQALTEAAKAVPSILLVASLPASDIEIGGDGGRAALLRLQDTFGRVQSPWRPASMEEGFEIVRRRLFEPISADGLKDRDAVIQHFADLYARHAGDFPAEAKEAAYQRRMAAAYPIHPELFDRLFTDWSTLDRFQRTRGVLKLMAAVIHSLWEHEDANLLILPGTIPLDDGSVFPQLAQYLEDTWAPIVEADVDGPSSVPLALDRENPGTFGRYSATRRVARTIFLGSAPTAASANKGLDDRRIKLGCVQPGEMPATFGDALRRLSDRAAHLYDNQSRYWYSTQPSVNRLARDRAEQVKPDAVVEELEARLRRECAAREPWARVHVAPRGAHDVPDTDEVGLVVLGPDYAHSTKTDLSKAHEAATAILEGRGAGPRTYRNMVVFLAADATRLSELEEAARQYLAWDSIWRERESLNLDAFQTNQTETKRKQADETVGVRIPETYIWALVPTQAKAENPVTIDAIRVPGQQALALRTAKKLEAEGLLLARMGGVYLRNELDKIPLWDGDAIGVRKLWEYFATYVYLPRLRDSSALTAAIEDGAGQLLWRTETFAYAGGRAGGNEGQPGRFTGLAAGRNMTVLLDGASLVVRAEAASAQMEADAAVVEGKSAGGGTGGGAGGDSGAGGYPPKPDGHGGVTAGIADRRGKRRFHGSFSLDPSRPAPGFSQAVQEVLTHLSGLTDTDVTVTVDITAVHRGDGFPDGVVRTVTENARTLKFTDAGFEEE